MCPQLEIIIERVGIDPEKDISQTTAEGATAGLPPIVKSDTERGTGFLIMYNLTCINHFLIV